VVDPASGTVPIEWSHKAMGNYVAALSRHFKPNTTPADVSDFAAFCRDFYSKITFEFETMDLSDYPTL